jgi:DNA (cytosine-5)-methyltransferase 1
VDHTSKLTHVSLCTGYAGIDIGLKRALSGALRSVAYVEIETFPISNLVSKIENGHLDPAPIYTDLKTFPWRRFHGRVDILSGGFPCQPFSSAGARRGDDDPRHLFPYILNGLRELGRPSLVFLENVEGIISSKLKGDGWSDPEGTPVLLHVLRELERVGYDATAGVFSAREIGAPHQRKRVFILACRSDLSESGRALVSGLLERGVNVVDSCDNSGRRSRGADVGHTHAWGREISERRIAGRCHEDVSATESGTAYPAPRGAEQHPWEPPRVTREAQPAMGGDADGAPCGLDYAELCRSVDNRTDELRLLGNGVVPDTATRAFRELWRGLAYTNSK